MFHSLIWKNNVTAVSTSGKNLLKLKSCNFMFSEVLSEKELSELAPLVKITRVADKQKGHWDLVHLPFTAHQADVFC